MRLKRGNQLSRRKNGIVVCKITQRYYLPANKSWGRESKIYRRKKGTTPKKVKEVRKGRELQSLETVIVYTVLKVFQENESQKLQSGDAN